jgi:DNA-binding transcriptional ArsR family regulator
VSEHTQWSDLDEAQRALEDWRRDSTKRGRILLWPTWCAPLRAGEVVDRARLSQPNASMHLRCLVECGLVTSGRRGKFVHSEIADKRVVLQSPGLSCWAIDLVPLFVGALQAVTGEDGVKSCFAHSASFSP